MLVIWPKRNRFRLLYSEEAFSRACQELPDTYDDEREELIEYILENINEDASTAVETLCRLVISEDDIEMWDRVVEECITEASACIDDEMKFQAIEQFEWAEVEYRYVELWVFRISSPAI